MSIQISKLAATMHVGIGRRRRTGSDACGETPGREGARVDQAIVPRTRANTGTWHASRIASAASLCTYDN